MGSDGSPPYPWGAPTGAPQQARQAMPDPTVGLIMAELKEIIGQLSTLAETVSGETKSVIQQAQASSSQLLAEIDHTLGKRQDRLVSDLNEAERRMVNDAKLLIENTKRAAAQVQAGAFQNARETLHESDIVAYNALHDIPCADKAPRLVYAKPSQFRVWKNSALAVDPEAGKPNDGSGTPLPRREAYISVRGNYLAYGTPTVTARVGSGEHRPAQIQSLNHNGFVAIVGPETMADLEAIQRPTPLEIRASVPRCPKAKGGPVETGVNVTVLPPLTYDVATIIRPRADLPVFGSQTFAYSQMGSDRCDDRKPIDETYSVGPPALVTDWRIHVNSLGGNSQINRVDRAGPNSVRVQATLQGKGRRCFMGVCDCRGRGWVNYGLLVNYKDYKAADLLASTLAREVAQNKFSYFFPYPHQFPPDMRNLACRYYSRVRISEGEQSAEVELTETIPSVNTPYGMVNSVFDRATCGVTVELPQPLLSKLVAGR